MLSGPGSSLWSDPNLALMATHLVAGAVTGLLLVLAVLGFARRGSRSYLFVVLALAALATRTVISVSTMFGPITPGVHHFVEHALDGMLGIFLLAAVYDARSGDARVSDETSMGDE